MLLSCSSDDDSIPGWPWTDPEEKPETPEPEDPYPDLINAGWTNVGADYGELPSYIAVYKAPSSLVDKKVVAYIAIADLANGGNFDVLGDLGWCDDANITNFGAEAVFTPSQFYDASKAPVIVNGGLFFSAEKTDGNIFYISQSLAMRESNLMAVNQTYWVQDWSSDPLVIWYPTIGAFLQKADGTCEATWTYTLSSGTTYCYPAPADNALDKAPLDVPSATFPEGATELNAVKGIGGVSVLVKGGEIKDTWKQELMDVSADSNQPRTAIGYTADKKLILFVCEGRNMTEGVAGLTTADEAQIMKALGCTEALNLDGGGSSCMLINGKETIQPSDGSQRAVLTGIRMY